MQTLKLLPRIAAVIALVIAGLLSLIGALGPIAVLPVALIPLCAGIGILRCRAWSAYGLATFYFAQLFVLPWVLSRSGAWIRIAPAMATAGFVMLGLGIFFLLAGRSMSASGAARGRAWPWIVVTALLTVSPFFVRTFEIASMSMENTLMQGDRIFAQVFPLRPPARGQLVLFRSPTHRDETLVKRVIAIPGDRLRIANNIVILNGAALNEKYVTHDPNLDQVYPENFPTDSFDYPPCAGGQKMLSQHVVNGEIVVPAESYFVLGDKREDSLDSRCYGFISASDLAGKPLMIYDSIEPTEEQTSDPNQSWRGHRRWTRLLKLF